MTKTTQVPTFTAKYRAEFAQIVESIDAITDQAVTDQQAGIPANRGREQYTSVAESSHYLNAWLKSMQVNGPAR